MKRILRYALSAALPLVLLLPLGAQDAKPSKKKKDTGITSEQAQQILDELHDIRQLLQQQQATLQALAEKNGPAGPERAKLDLSGFQMLGSKTAPLTLVEFTDYQCPYCRQFHVNVFHELKKNYIDTGKVRFYSRDLPLDQIHPNAIRAAEAGRCAADQGQFWAMRELMGSNPDKLDLENLVTEAGTLKMDPKVFRTCVESQKYKQAVQSDVLEAMKIGAEATPTFVLGKSTPEGVDGQLIVGSQPYSEFVRQISKLDSK
ncbi:MAG TPA: thioredoxin domain-containing protein [Bryobacteraceae bacterium]|nr:thioredoxin domain-containing protein [Bryobacteraceae bacterium]